jgi:aspartyl-tRNA(Asn)/glutamyl-tRNA(Gln) amidotransferase subunit A
MFSISNRPTIREIHSLYTSGKATVTQVSQFFLNRIKEKDSEINGFVRVIGDFGLEISKELDLELQIAQSSNKTQELLYSKPLFGIPFGIKDIVQIEGQVFTSSSDILSEFAAPYSSTVYEKLKVAGAVCLGVCNMDSHAMGASGENSDYGPSRNPFDTSRTCGGSSCGSVAVVASGQVVFAIGTDTGGSVRQPSAFTDLVGIKPTYGLVSRWGITPMASSLDQAAPITNSVEDNLNILHIISGKDSKDQTSIESTKLQTKLQELSTKIADKVNENRNSTKLTKSSNPITIGVIKEFMSDAINPIIKKALEDTLDKLQSLGHKIEYISLPIVNDAIGLYYITMAVEVASNLQRIDGVRYAKQPFVGNGVDEESEEMYFDHRREYFPDELSLVVILPVLRTSKNTMNKAKKSNHWRLPSSKKPSKKLT